MSKNGIFDGCEIVDERTQGQVNYEETEHTPKIPPLSDCVNQGDLASIKQQVEWLRQVVIMLAECSKKVRKLSSSHPGRRALKHLQALDDSPPPIYGPPPGAQPVRREAVIEPIDVPPIAPDDLGKMIVAYGAPFPEK